MSISGHRIANRILLIVLSV